MGGILSVYNLGRKGCNVDRDPVQLEDGELTKAQNLTVDQLGADGGVRKRPGLVKINSVAAAGSIVGAIGVPLNKIATRTFLAGQWTGATGAWNVSTDAWATGGTSGGPNGYDASATPRIPSNVWTNLADSNSRQRAFAGRPSCLYKNRFYYAGNDYTLGTTAPTIRVWDGTTDFLLTTIPYNPDIASTTAASAVLCMIAANGKIYLSTYDGGQYSANTVKCRLWQLDPENGGLIQLGSRFPFDGARSPYALCWWQKRLWTRTFTGGVSATSLTYYMRPGVDTDWTLDNTSSGAQTCTEMIVYQGQLYFATMSDQATAPIVQVRSQLGVYSTSKTAALNEGGSVPVMASFGRYGHFGAMAVFGGNLYVTYFNWEAGDLDRHIRIYKFDGTTWTVVYNPAVNHATAVPYQTALVHNSVLYFQSSPAFDSSNNVNQMLKTTNGSSWTVINSTQLANNSSSALGVITT